MHAPPTLHKPDPVRIEKFHFEGTTRRLRSLTTAENNYFDAFGLQPRLLLDLEALRGAFLELSRTCHPDYFSTAPDAERAESLRRSALVNNAYKTLTDSQKRAEYLIFLLGNDIESNKNAVPPELLEEIFEIQEAGDELREARLAADGERLRRAEESVRHHREHASAAREKLGEQLLAEFATLDRILDGGGAPEGRLSQDALRKIRLTLDRMNYLRTVLRNLR